MALRRVDEPLADEALCGRVPAAALADGDDLGARGERERFGVHERVVEHDVRAREHLRRADRQQIRRAGSRADEVNGA